MREPLYRGKRADNNEWAYGFLTKIRNNNSFLSLCIECEEKGEMWFFIIEPETAGQYTGLTDKNGKMIFEGDIALYNREKHTVVFEIRGGTSYFGIKFERWDLCLSVPAKLMEVIGNIHDNPELAEGLL